jgi:hypothetical protein
LRTDCINDLGAHTASKLYSHRHVDILFSHAMKLLGLIRILTFSFPTIDSLLMLYFVAVRSKLEYTRTSVAWNSVTATDTNKLERIQRKFAAIYRNRFFRHVEFHYETILKKINLQTLRTRWSFIMKLY